MRISDWSSDVCSSDLKNTTFGTTWIDSRAKPDKPGGGNGNGGGGGGNKPSKATTFFTPVNPILQAYHLSILTGTCYRATPPHERKRPGQPGNRTGVAWGNSGSVSVYLGGRPNLKKKK